MMARCGGLSPLGVAFHGEVSVWRRAFREADVGLSSTVKMMVVVVVLVEELGIGQGEEEGSGGIAVRKRRLDLVLRS